MFLIRLRLIFSFLLTSFLGFSQNDSLFQVFVAKVSQQPAYSCDFNLLLDVDFINLPQKRGTLTYSPKKGLDYNFKGIGFFPKKSMNQQMSGLLESDYSVLFIGEDAQTIRYKIVPTEMDSEILLADITLEKETGNIVIFNSVTKEAGKVRAEFNYDPNWKNFMLPSTVVITFNLKNRQLPATFTGDFENMDTEFDMEKESEATLTLTYTNYQIKE